MPTSGYIDNYYTFSMNDRGGFAVLDGDLDVDVAIIGGGFTGVASAYELASKGVRVALCERNLIGSGASGRNGGQVTGSLSGEAAMLREFRRTLGNEAVDYIWRLRWRGREIIRDRIKTHRIDCDFQEGHVEAALSKRQTREIHALKNEADARGNPDQVLVLDRDGLTDLLGSRIYHCGLYNPRNFNLHPLNLCIGQARVAATLGAQIFERTEVTAILPERRPKLVTDAGTITADKVLIAGNYNTPYLSPKTMGVVFPASLGIIATAPLTEQQRQGILRNRTAVYDRRIVLDYYRLTADNRLLFGGGTNYSGLATPDLRRKMRPSLERTFPQLEGIPIDFAWSGHDGIVINRIPHLGRINESIFYARGYSGHGIGLSHSVAQIMTEAMLFDPSELEIFENAAQYRLPVPRALGGAIMAVGMAYFRAVDRLGARF